MSTPLFVELVLRWHASHFVIALYRAILGRAPDPDGLATCTARLRKTGDLFNIAFSIANSEEAKNKVLFGTPETLVLAAFQGLLDRAPEPDASMAYSQHLAAKHDLADFLKTVRDSDEHWQRLLADRADIVVRAAYRALLRREPDVQALATYAQELRVTGDVAGLLSTIAESHEHSELVLRGQSPTSQPNQELPAFLAKALKSPKIWSDINSFRHPLPGAALAAYDSECWVFIHAQKTGGTSVQSMLVDIFGDAQVYREHADLLYIRSPADLAEYSIFAGHFDFDTVHYIPRQTRRLFTFLREPRQRLLSHYRFLRAHLPASPSFQSAMEIAGRLEAAEFFRSYLASTTSDYWNHLTWCVMGQRQWGAYRDELSNLDAAAVTRRLADIRVDIRKRLREFAFIGMQEDFSFSCEQLFALIGVGLPHVRHEHSVELLSANQSHFRYVPQRPLTRQLEAALTHLVQLDDIVYQEGLSLYEQRYGRAIDAQAHRATWSPPGAS